MRKFRKQERSRIRLEREACKLSGVLVAEEPRLAFVMRIKGINQVHPKIRKILQLFRLRQINTGVFVKLNKATVTMLRLVEPYIAWGYLPLTFSMHAPNQTHHPMMGYSTTLHTALILFEVRFESGVFWMLIALASAVLYSLTA